MDRTEYRTQKCRRILKKAGLDLHKSRIRDITNERYGSYTIVEHSTGKTVAILGQPYTQELDEVEEFIKADIIPKLLEQSHY